MKDKKNKKESTYKRRAGGIKAGYEQWNMLLLLLLLYCLALKQIAPNNGHSRNLGRQLLHHTVPDIPPTEQQNGAITIAAVS